ncbi:MAG: hypothetical protein AAGD25_15055 [Cyanobacteria bacterium P01_F01_bin.150]
MSIFPTHHGSTPGVSGPGVSGPGVSRWSGYELPRYRFPIERLGRAIALLLGMRLLTMGVGWLLLRPSLSPSIILGVLGIGGMIAGFAYWSITPYPLARLRTPSAQFYIAVGVAGLLLGLF